MKLRLLSILALCTILWSVVRADVYSPIAQVSDLKSGDRIIIAMQNGRSRTAWYAIKATNNNTWNTQSISVRNNLIRSTSSDIIWNLTVTDGKYYISNPLNGTTYYVMGSTNGWHIASIASNRFALSNANTNDTLIWRSGSSGVHFDYLNRQGGDTIVFDQVDLGKNLTTGAFAFNIFKQSPVARFDAGEYGWLADGDSIRIPDTKTGQIELPSCFYNRHHPFLGWSTTKNSTNADAGKSGDKITLTSDQTFYAVYDTVAMPTQCFDYTDLYANYVTCRYASNGSEANYPDNYNAVGVKTGDPTSYDTHINVITDPNSYCRFAGAKEIPNGCTNSIRLGNYVESYGAEDVEYSVTVDTTESPILLMRYLPVLEKSHSGGAGMRLSILDERNQIINPECASFNFRLDGSTIVGNMPGNPIWHTTNDYYWHDWATLGVDLTPYHGQNIVIKIQTFDCDAGAHMGYGYFNLSCQDKKINVYACDNAGDSIDLTTCEGFFYRWYKSSDPSKIIGTTRSIKVVEGTDSLYYCDLSVDAEFKCKFTLSAEVKRRHPVADFTYDIHRGLCGDTVYIHHNSFASPDGVNEFTPHQNCDYALWDFGDATTPSGTPPDVHEYIPSQPLIYTRPGQKTIKLKVCLQDWDCSVDSTEHSFAVTAGEEYQITYDTICLGESFTFWGRDLKPTRAGDHVYLNQVTDAVCFDKITLEEHLFVTPKYEFIEYDTLCRGEELDWHGKKIDFPGVYYDSLTTYAGCDSVYVLNLAYRPKKASTTIVYDTICGSDSYIWHNAVYKESGEYIMRYTDQDGCDSIEILNLYVLPVHGVLPITPPGRPNYWDDPYYKDTVAVSTGNQPGNWNDPYRDTTNTEGVRPSNWADPYVTQPIIPGTPPGYWDDPYIDIELEKDTICEGDEFLWHGKVLTETGTYSDTLSNILGCDSIVYIHLTTNPSYHFESEVVLEYGEKYVWTGHKKDTIISTEGEYRDSLKTFLGCDSVFVLKVDVNTENETTIVDTICANKGYAWHNNGRDTSLTTAGEYVDTLTNHLGGDSIVNLHLYVNPITYSHQMSAVCEGDSAFWNDEFYKVAGTYTDTLVNQWGCDSILTFVLKINTRDTTITNDTICQGQTYRWNGKNYTETASDTVRMQNRLGCDSIDILHLFVEQTVYQKDIDSICEGDSLFFYGTYLHSPGIYSKTLTSVITNCDSVYSLELIVFPLSPDTSVYDTICQNQTYQERTYADVGDYNFVDSLYNVHGCDSVVYRHLHVNAIYDTLEYAVICDRDSFIWHGKTLKAEGLYTDTVATMCNCDSICHLELKVKRVDEPTEYGNICGGTSYLWHGKEYAVRGVYTDTLTNILGCDSITHLDLLVAAISDTTEYDSVCSNERYWWHGHIYRTGGYYTDTLRDIRGCDSITHLVLTSLKSYESTEYDTICAGETYLWRGYARTETGIFHDTMQTVSGCDSVFTLNLEVKDSYTSAENIIPPSHPIYWDDPYYKWNADSSKYTLVYWDDPYMTDSTKKPGTKPGTWDDPYVTDSVQKGQRPGYWDDPYVTREIKPDTICDNEKFNWYGKLVNQPGYYFDTITTAFGCDSLVYLQLVVMPTYDTLMTETLCNGDSILWHNIYRKDAITYIDTLQTIYGCDSICRLNLTYLQDAKDIASDTTLCEGDTELWRGQTITEAGIYRDTLKYTTGCDSIRYTRTVTIHAAKDSTETMTICEGSTVNWHGQDLTDEGIYYDTLHYHHTGCDSVRFAMTLTVQTAKDSVERDTICEGDELAWHGQTLNETGSYYDTLHYAITNCDSIRFQLELVRQDVTEYNSDTTLCEGDIELWRGQTITEAGIYRDTLKYTTGCDSICYTRTVAIHEAKDSTETMTICEGSTVNWHGQDLTDEGIYYDTLHYAVSNCDSIRFAMTLTVQAAKDSIEHDTICGGNELAWHGQTLSETGTYYDTLYYALTNCDSIRFTLHLTRQEVTEYNSDTTLCEGDAELWRGQTITESGIYRDTLKYATGCDSIRYIHTVAIHTAKDSIEEITIFKGNKYNWHGQEIADEGTYYDTLHYQKTRCDSIRFAMTLTVQTAKDSVEHDTICEGDEYGWHGQVLSETGIYYDTLHYMVTNSDSIRFKLYLTRQDVTEYNSDTTLCEGDVELWRGQTITEAGIYRDTLKYTTGCDSIRYTRTVTIHAAKDSTETMTICEGSTVNWHGQDLTDEGIYYDTLHYHHTGCDSVRFAMTLTVQTAKDSVERDTICGGNELAWHGQTLSEAGTYYDTLYYALTNCDSIRFQLKLVRQDVTEYNSDTTLCEGDIELWRGQTITEAGTYRDTLKYTTGCDSIRYTRTVTIHAAKDSTETMTICESSTINWHGQEIADEGIYYDTLHYAVSNCDSIRFAMTLTIQAAKDSIEHDTICGGDELAWHGQTLSETGTYYDTLHYYVTNCDSIRFTLHLTRQEVTEYNSDTTLCEGDAELWRGQTITESGIYRDTLKYATGCDSIRYTRTVTIHAAKDSTETMTICEGSTVNWHGQDLAEAGTYYDTLQYQNALCDSVRFTLIVNMAIDYDTTEHVSICRGETYVWHGQTITGEGSYVDILPTVNGCDSTCRLVLKVPEPYYYEFDTTLCEGSSIYFNGKWISDAGIYHDSLLTSKGCDSIITMNLTVTQRMRGTLTIPDICADDEYIPVSVNYTGNTPTHYSAYFSTAAQQQQFKNENYTPLVNFDSTIYIPVPHTEDRRKYPRPDIYSLKVVAYDTICGDSITKSEDFIVSYPSWITDVRWNDAIILYNDRYNGGYTFSAIQWYYDGEPIDGETKDFLYLVHTLDMNKGGYQAKLTRSDDGKTFFTCPVYPQPVKDSVLVTENYLTIVPTLVHKSNPTVDIQTNMSGRYYLYDAAGRLIGSEDFVPCEHNAITVKLPNVSGMYIFYFDLNEDDRHFTQKVIVW